MSASAVPIWVQEYVTSLKPANEYILLWSALFFVCRFVLFRGKSADFANRIVSLIHALVAIVLSCRAVNWNDPLGNVGGPNSPEQARYMRIPDICEMALCRTDTTLWA